MDILLDTQIMLLLEKELNAIKPSLLHQFEDPVNTLWVSAASIWEIAIKQEKGTLKFDGSALAVAKRRGYQLLPIQAEHAEEAASLPMFHRDPFDRMIIAQARTENFALATMDATMRKYAVTML